MKTTEGQSPGSLDRIVRALSPVYLATVAATVLAMLCGYDPYPSMYMGFGIIQAALWLSLCKRRPNDQAQARRATDKNVKS